MGSTQLHPGLWQPSRCTFRKSPAPFISSSFCHQKPFVAARVGRFSGRHACGKARWAHPAPAVTVCSASPDPTSVATPIASVRAEEIKQQLLEAFNGTGRGIFGVQAAKAKEISSLVEQLEVLNPLALPTQHLDQVAGTWRLLYSTIAIQGSKRTKLGLREFMTLGNFLQKIDIEKQQAVNEVFFNVTGFGMLNGKLSILATYEVVSATRVDITFEQSTLVPDQLQRLFEKNYDLLLSVFNPEGWLEITYVDDTMRVGRDDKGNVFVLERYAEDAPMV